MSPEDGDEIHMDSLMDYPNPSGLLLCHQQLTKTTQSTRRKRFNSLLKMDNYNAMHLRSNKPWLFISAVIFFFVTQLAHCPAQAVVLNVRDRHIAHRPHCTDVQIEEATKMADVVVSGKVVKLMQDEAHSTNQLHLQKGEIEIKRVFKGEEVVDKMAEVIPGRMRPHKMVMVEGFGDPVICHNKVRERDTKIFLLKPNGNGELKLNSSVVTLTLRNLDYVDAVVHNVVYTPEKPKEISPCYLYFCPFGATCHVNETTRKPVCVCEQKCSNVFAPVCGSDGAIYINQCMMDRMSCVRNRKIRHVSRGRCGKVNPCTSKSCKFGAECMPSQDGLTARCQCPSECPNYGDSQGGRPVCGSNGVDYPNMCELRKESCTSMKNIRVKYYGKCDPCQGIRCAEPKVCKVMEHDRSPSCACNIFCPTELNFVCGTDGKTYSNSCLLKQQACRSGQDIRQLFDGRCSPENNPCMHVKCGPMESCTVDKSGRAVCICPPECEPVLRLVCGNDSITYDNECELRRRACLDKNYVVVAKQGACGKKSACDGYVCDYHARCVVYKDRPKCECRQCTQEHDPVCGDDGITYENECKLHEENCRNEERVQVAKRGVCESGCGEQRCEFYAVCQTGHGGPTCVCPKDCVEVYSPVCGNDGVTYDNECELRVASCHKRTFLTIASTGSCDKCKGVKCDHYAKCESGTCVCPIICPDGREPVCGTDDRTYKNECEMRKHACANSKDIQVAFMGECSGDPMLGGSGDGCDDEDDEACGSGDGRVDGKGDKETMMTTTKSPPKEPCTVQNCMNFGGECSLIGVEYECECNFKCDTSKNPVCGSDGLMYHNECDMAYASCVKKERIHKQPVENCDEFDSEEMCGGSKPLVNPSSGGEYDCNPGMDTCPDGSYCHYTLQFAKCCKSEPNPATSKPPITNCSETEFGCCKDGLTPAKGAGKGGCPDVCQCHPLGSFSTTCHPISRQCTCKPGVGGKRCDRCQIGYWAMHQIAQGNTGCIPCRCDLYGSARDDCDQMTGRCACKPSIRGMKCEKCSDGSKPGPSGCRDQEPPTSCADLTCPYGGTCEESHSGPHCTCDLDCDTVRPLHGSGSQHDMVCGTDGQNYASECQLRVFACRLGQDIAVDHRGACKAPPITPVTTSSPVTRSRKTTRHTDGMTGSGSEENGEISQPREEGDKECRKRQVGQICLREEDCCPTNGVCNGVCECQDGFVSSLDNTLCVEVKKSPREDMKNVTDACTVDPCEAGKCTLNKLLGYRCACPVGKAGTLCNERLMFTVPSFSGLSHLELPRLEGAKQSLSIEVTFTTLNDDGIILFNAKHKNGSGDFVSLAVKDGFLEFRYDLGGGPAILRSREKVSRKTTHRVIAQRDLHEGTMVVDNGERVKGSSPSTHVSLELNDPLYLGHVPMGTPETFQRIGVRYGLNGCIQTLKAGENRDSMRTYNLGLRDFSDVQGGVDIVECGTNQCHDEPCKNGGICLVLDKHGYECSCKKGYSGHQCEELEDPCAPGPCQHGGTCVPMISSNTFFCQCPEGREGIRCERESIPEVYVPQFTGDSYMELPLDESLSNSLRITIWFLAVKPDGVLMFATQTAGGGGDFIALNLVNKKLVFSFYLGSGLGVIESKKHIHLDKWHEVTINRTGKLGQMTIDDHPPVTGEAKYLSRPGSSSMLNMDKRPLFLGGFRSLEDLPAQADIKKGFTGAIQKVTINGRTIDGLMSSALTMRNISTYNGPPCKVNPCMNGGVCVPALNLADCRCPSNYMGKNCEKRFEQMDLDQPIQFDGSSFLSYPNEITNKQEGQRDNDFFIRFRVAKPDGILLLQSAGNTVTFDYLLLAVEAGHVIFSYNLGKQGPGNLHIIRSTVNVMDGYWHTVRVMRNKREGTLQVDNEAPLISGSDAGTQQLDTDGYLWLGGRSDLPWGLPVTDGLEGCISEVTINGQSLHLVLNKMPDAMTESTAFTFCEDKEGA